MPRAKVLTPAFFNQPTLKIAPKLLGKFLVRKIGRRVICGMITEVEAYVGPEDKASHASAGMTNRTKVMFEKAGYWYVYLIYGMYYCLNIVTGREHYPAAILIRSVAFCRTYQRPLISAERGKKEIIGPGRVCRYFEINKGFNAKLASKKTSLWIEDWGVKINPRRIWRGKRVGVDYAGKWKEKLWRFYLK